MTKALSIIIPVQNEKSTIADVIRECFKLDPRAEVVVVANGCSDVSDQIARKNGARVIAIDESLGHDTGRSVGARHATGDIFLFIDGDMVVRAEQLKPFVERVQLGADIVLNRYDGPVHRQHIHDVVLAKHVLNAALHRPDLRGWSLCTVPHAMSRRAAMLIGLDKLAVPPLAHAAAVYGGLRVISAPTVPVGKLNPSRSRRANGDPTGRLMLGDHLEALAWLLARTGPRGNRHDFNRRREEVNGI